MFTYVETLCTSHDGVGDTTCTTKRFALCASIITALYAYEYIGIKSLCIWQIGINSARPGTQVTLRLTEPDQRSPDENKVDNR